MRIFPLVRSEFARLTSSRLGIAALVVLMTVPVIYGGLYLWGNKDPYNELDRVPAALVVEDTGTTVDGEVVNYGQEAADELLDDGTFGWSTVSAAEAQAGIEDGTYDFGLTFPSGFSADLASAADDNPVQASLELTTDDTNGYLSTTFAKQAADTVRVTLASEVGEKASVSLLEAISDIRDGLGDASDGASDLADGTSDAADGASDLADGTTKLADGASDLSDGTTALASGADDLSDGTTSLATGADTLADGTTTLADGAADLRTGTSRLATGAATLRDGNLDLASGAKELRNGLSDLADASADLPSGTAALSDGASQVADGLDTAAAGAADLSNATGQAASLTPTIRDQAAQLFADEGITSADSARILAELDALDTATTGIDDAVSGQLAPSLDALSTGASTVADGAATLSASAPALVAGINSAADGSATLSSGASDAAAGAKTLASGARDAARGAKSLSSGADELSSGARTLAGGAEDAATGASTLANGADDAAAGAVTLSDGASDAAAGADDLSAGLVKLDDGSQELSSSLADAVTDIPATTADERADTAAAIADPVDVKRNAVTEASNYGAGLAPFFISLSAWIGIYALFLLVRPLSRRALTAVRRPIRTTLAGWATPALLGALQMVMLFLTVTLALHLEVANGLGLLAFMMFVSVTFAAIILALNALFGSAGQFLGLVLMIVQLVTAGGTFPWQTLPGPLAFVHQALPMSHAVEGVRQLMYGGSADAVLGTIVPLALWLVGALAVTALAALKQGRVRTLRELRPSPIGG